MLCDVFEMSTNISLLLLVRLSPSLVNVQASSPLFITNVFFLNLGCMLVNWDRLLWPTIVGSTAKQCVDQYMVLFCDCPLGGNTAMLGGLHARICDAFLVKFYFQMGNIIRTPKRYVIRVNTSMQSFLTLFCWIFQDTVATCNKFYLSRIHNHCNL